VPQAGILLTWQCASLAWRQPWQPRKPKWYACGEPHGGSHPADRHSGAVASGQSAVLMQRHALHAHPLCLHALQLELEATGQGWLDEQQQLRITLDSTLSALSERCVLLHWRR
jgi:hypothetical protein